MKPLRSFELNLATQPFTLNRDLFTVSYFLATFTIAGRSKRFFNW